MLESKRVLLDVMSEAEALEVMLANPAVLQCGPSLEALGPSEIQAFARLRALGSRCAPPVHSHRATRGRGACTCAGGRVGREVTRDRMPDSFHPRTFMR